MVPVSNAPFHPRDPGTVKQNEVEKQDGDTVLLKDRLALAELEAFTGALLHPTTHKSDARWGPRIESN